MEILKKYQEKLSLIRVNKKLLENYRFVSPKKSNHFERLRLNVAIYNDLKPTDFEIAKFLFDEECKWRKERYINDEEELELDKNENVDNLYFSAWILVLLNQVEVIWDFYNAKNIDFDSSIGFDGEYLVAFGIEKTYYYLQTSDNPLKEKIYNYLGKSIKECTFSQDWIKQWLEHKKQYFRHFKYSK
jgi:hypothetical protein